MWHSFFFSKASCHFFSLTSNFKDVSGGVQPPHVVPLYIEIVNMKTAKIPKKISRANILRAFMKCWFSIIDELLYVKTLGLLATKYQISLTNPLYPYFDVEFL